MTPPSLLPKLQDPEAAPADAAPATPELRGELVLAELSTIVGSDTFRRAKRLKSFLRFLVSRAIAVRGDELTEYAIGREVFGKPPEYDPRRDPLVRVEFSRLRARLKLYYETEGVGDPVTIGIWRRSYRVWFERRHAPDLPGSQDASTLVPASEGDAWPPLVGSEPAGTATPADGILSVLVLPFVDLSPRGDQGYFCDGITVEIINRLARVKGLHVVARSSAFQFRGAAQDIQQIGQRLKVRVVVEGSVRKERGRWRINRNVIDTSTGFLVWTDVFERPGSKLLALQSQVAAATARLLRLQLGEQECHHLLERPGPADVPSVEREAGRG